MLETTPGVRVSRLKDEEYYLFRAEETRTIAFMMKNRVAREILLDISEDYEKMAKTVRDIQRPV